MYRDTDYWILDTGQKKHSLAWPVSSNRHPVSVYYSHQLLLKLGKNFEILVYENSYTLISIIFFCKDAFAFLLVRACRLCFDLLAAAPLSDIVTSIESSLFFFFRLSLKISLKRFRRLSSCLWPNGFTLLADDTDPSGLLTFILSTINLPWGGKAIPI